MLKANRSKVQFLNLVNYAIKLLETQKWIHIQCAFYSHKYELQNIETLAYQKILPQCKISEKCNFCKNRGTILKCINGCKTNSTKGHPLCYQLHQKQEQSEVIPYVLSCRIHETQDTQKNIVRLFCPDCTKHVYCICGKFREGDEIAQCIVCENWFHNHCVKFNQIQDNDVCTQCLTNQKKLKNLEFDLLSQNYVGQRELCNILTILQKQIIITQEISQNQQALINRLSIRINFQSLIQQNQQKKLKLTNEDQYLILLNLKSSFSIEELRKLTQTQDSTSVYKMMVSILNLLDPPQSYISDLAEIYKIIGNNLIEIVHKLLEDQSLLKDLLELDLVQIQKLNNQFLNQIFFNLLSNYLDLSLLNFEIVKKKNYNQTQILNFENLNRSYKVFYLIKQLCPFYDLNSYFIKLNELQLKLYNDRQQVLITLINCQNYKNFKSNIQKLEFIQNYRDILQKLVITLDTNDYQNQEISEQLKNWHQKFSWNQLLSDLLVKYQYQNKNNIKQKMIELVEIAERYEWTQLPLYPEIKQLIQIQFDSNKIASITIESSNIFTNTIRAFVQDLDQERIKNFTLNYQDFQFPQQVFNYDFDNNVLIYQYFFLSDENPQFDPKSILMRIKDTQILTQKIRVLSQLEDQEYDIYLIKDIIKNKQILYSIEIKIYLIILLHLSNVENILTKNPIKNEKIFQDLQNDHQFEILNGKYPKLFKNIQYALHNQQNHFLKDFDGWAGHYAKQKKTLDDLILDLQLIQISENHYDKLKENFIFLNQRGVFYSDKDQQILNLIQNQDQANLIDTLKRLND